MNKVFTLNAFTLAEVLITLGIIGIVAAMTMPILIGNYKKNETITKLKKTYAILSNVLNRAKVDYGDPYEWTFEGVGVDYDNDRETARSAIRNAIKKYILPYLADGYRYQDDAVTLQSLGYNTPWKNYNKSIFWNTNTSALALILNDGTPMFINPITGTINNEDGSTTKILMGLNFNVDINGPKSPNIRGKDIFTLSFPFTSNSKLFFYQSFVVTNGGRGSTELKATREEMLKDCETLGAQCGALIQADGWEINYKY